MPFDQLLVDGQRRDLRVSADGEIRLLFTSRTGEELVAHAKLIDISASGLRASTTVALPERGRVVVNGMDGRLSCAASVRFCRPQGIRFTIGLEFTNFRFHSVARPKPRWN